MFFLRWRSTEVPSHDAAILEYCCPWAWTLPGLSIFNDLIDKKFYVLKQVLCALLKFYYCYSSEGKGKKCPSISILYVQDSVFICNKLHISTWSYLHVYERSILYLEEVIYIKA